MTAARVVQAEPKKRKTYRPPLRIVHPDASKRHAEALNLMAKSAIMRQRRKPGPSKYAV